MADEGGPLVDPEPAALAAAADAFAAARTARRLLDAAGLRGAEAVNRSRPIPGARRASDKAQASLEEAARKLEDARDRWAALMRGIAVDLGVEPDRLVGMVEHHALEIGLEQLEAALLACRDAAAAMNLLEIPSLEVVQRAIELVGARLGRRRRGGNPPMRRPGRTNPAAPPQDLPASRRTDPR